MTEEFIICQICKTSYRALGPHLKVHNITTREYSERFPNSPTISEVSREAHTGTGEAISKGMSIDVRQQMSKSLMGHVVLEDTRKEISRELEGHEVSDITRTQISNSCKENWKDPEYSRRISVGVSETLTGLWKNPAFAMSMSKAWSRKPNSPETSMLGILERNFPGDWKYTGDGTFWVEGRNPDFTNVNGKKQVIEVFGAYWHDPSYFPHRPTDEELVAHYKRYGFECIVFWEYDAYDEVLVADKVKELNGKLKENKKSDVG